MARMSAKESAVALLASVQAVEALVKALAQRKLDPPDMDRTRKNDVRYAPYYGPGKRAAEPHTVAYNSRWLEKAIIADEKPSKWLRVALQLLERRERGYVDAYVFDAIRQCRPGYSLGDLERGIKMRAHEWEALHSADIALGLLK